MSCVFHYLFGKKEDIRQQPFFSVFSSQATPLFVVYYIESLFEVLLELLIEKLTNNFIKCSNEKPPKHHMNLLRSFTIQIMSLHMAKGASNQYAFLYSGVLFLSCFKRRTCRVSSQWVFF